MARSYTRSQIRTRARLHADLEGTDVGVLDARVNELIDHHLTEVYRELVKAGPPDHYSSDQTITTVSGTLAYAVPADYWQTSAVYAEQDSSGRRPLREINSSQRIWYRPPQGAYTVYHEYIAAPPTLALDTSTFDGVAGFEELIAKLVARDLLAKERADAMGLTAECMRLLAEVRSSGRRTRMSREITDVYASDDYAWAGTNRLLAFRLRAGNIELYERRVYPP